MPYGPIEGFSAAQASECQCFVVEQIFFDNPLVGIAS
jgi:hypothetical protein